MNRFLIYILGVSLIINLAVAVFNYNHESRFIDPDSNDYIELADSLALFHGYTKDGQTEIFRAPGYSFFLAPFRYLFPDTLFPVVIIQCLLNAGSILILWYLTLSLARGNLVVAKIAVTFQAISLSSIVYTNKVLTETLFTFLLMLFLFLVDKMVKEMILQKDSASPENNKKNKMIYITSFAAGFTAGCLTLVRAIFLPLFPLFLIFIWLQGASSIREKRSSKVYKLILVMLLPYFLAIGGWSLRNSLTAGYNGFSSVGSINIYRYYACALLAHQKGISFAEQQGICDANLAAAGTEVEQAKYSLKHGIPVLTSSPLTYLFLHLKTDMNTLLPAVGDFYALAGKNIGGKGTLGVINSRGILAGVKHYFAGNWSLFILALPLISLLLIKYISAAVGGGKKLFTKQLNYTAILYIALILYMIIIPGAVSHPRFRVPVEPLLSMFAALGLYTIFQFFKKVTHSKKSKG